MHFPSDTGPDDLRCIRRLCPFLPLLLCLCSLSLKQDTLLLSFSGLFLLPFPLLILFTSAEPFTLEKFGFFLTLILLSDEVERDAVVGGFVIVVLLGETDDTLDGARRRHWSHSFGYVRCWQGRHRWKMFIP